MHKNAHSCVNLAGAQRSRVACSARGSRRVVVLLGLLAIGWIGPRCGQTDLRPNLAQDLLEAGNFDQAFEAYERLYQEGARKPAVLSGLGLILTLQPTSIFAGIDLMESSLKERADENVREQLMLTYLALDRVDLARNLIHPDRLSVEQVYSPGITRLRLGLNCLYRPGPSTLQTLSELPEHPRRDFFLLLCGIAQSKKPEQFTEQMELWRALKARDARIACEALAVWPRELPAPPATSGTFLGGPAVAEFVAAGEKNCRRDFPGDVSVQRDRPIALADGAGPDPASQSLFDVDVFDPGDPGAEYEPRDSRRAPAADAGGSDGPFIPIPTPEPYNF